MTMMTLTQNEQPVSSGFRVDVSRGERVGRVSSEWFSRPDDERYLSLTELYDAVRGRPESAQVRTVESRAVRVEAGCRCLPRKASKPWVAPASSIVSLGFSPNISTADSGCFNPRW